MQHLDSREKNVFRENGLLIIIATKQRKWIKIYQLQPTDVNFNPNEANQLSGRSVMKPDGKVKNLNFGYIF